MPVPTATRTIIVLVVAASIGAGYWWWNRPERQIERLLADVASALSAEGGRTDMRALAELAALQTLLAPDVVIDSQSPTAHLQGRQDVVATVGRLRASMPMLRLQFFDAKVDVMDSSAMTSVTAQITTRDAAGVEAAAAYAVFLDLQHVEGRWVIRSARIDPGGGAPL